MQHLPVYKPNPKTDLYYLSVLSTQLLQVEDTRLESHIDASVLSNERSIAQCCEGLYLPNFGVGTVKWVHFDDYGLLRKETAAEFGVYVKLGDYMIQLGVFMNPTDCKATWQFTMPEVAFPQRAYNAKHKWLEGLLNDYSMPLSDVAEQFGSWSFESSVKLDLVMREVAFRKAGRPHALRLSLAKGAVRTHRLPNGSFYWPTERINEWLTAISQ